MNTTMKPINIDLNQYFQLMSLIYKDLFSLLHSSSNSNHYSLIRIADPQCLASLIVQIVQTILRRQPTTAVLVIAQSPDTFRQIPVPSMDELNPFTCSNPANSNSQTLESIQVIMEHHVYIRYTPTPSKLVSLLASVPDWHSIMQDQPAQQPPHLSIVIVGMDSICQGSEGLMTYASSLAMDAAKRSSRLLNSNCSLIVLVERDISASQAWSDRFSQRLIQTSGGIQVEPAVLQPAHMPSIIIHQ
ncbi:hypothetical protein RTP6_000320 [Batrachochytrium dendrobatidis]